MRVCLQARRAREIVDYSPDKVSNPALRIPRVRVGYELAIIISYPTSASGITVLLKTLTKEPSSRRL